MNFELYMTTDKVVKKLTGQKVSVTENYFETIESALLTEPDSIERSNSLMELVSEHLFWTRNNPTIFIEDQSLVDMVCKARYSVSIEHLLFPVSSVFSVSFASSIRINGILPPPFLISAITMSNPNCKDSKGRRVKCVIYVSCRAPDLGNLHKTYNDIEPISNLMNLKDEGGMNEIEHVMIDSAARLGIGLVVASQAFPDIIKPGFPSLMKERMRRTVRVGSPFRTNCPERMKNSPSPHWRQGHFRHLYHEKFRRDELGHVKTIYVNPCIVSGTVDPYTTTTRGNHD